MPYVEGTFGDKSVVGDERRIGRGVRFEALYSNSASAAAGSFATGKYSDLFI